MQRPGPQLPSIRQLHPYLPPPPTAASYAGSPDHAGSPDPEHEHASEQEGDERDGDDQPPKKRRRRQALSCTECKRRKIRCDRAQPCAPCVRRGDQEKCQWHFVEPVNDKYVPRAEHDALRARVDALEAYLRGVLPADLPPFGAGVGTTPVASSGAQQSTSGARRGSTTGRSVTGPPSPTQHQHGFNTTAQRFDTTGQAFSADMAGLQVFSPPGRRASFSPPDARLEDSIPPTLQAFSPRPSTVAPAQLTVAPAETHTQPHARAHRRKRAVSHSTSQHRPPISPPQPLRMDPHPDARREWGAPQTHMQPNSNPQQRKRRPSVSLHQAHTQMDPEPRREWGSGFGVFPAASGVLATSFGGVIGLSSTNMGSSSVGTGGGGGGDRRERTGGGMLRSSGSFSTSPHTSFSASASSGSGASLPASSSERESRHTSFSSLSASPASFLSSAPRAFRPSSGSPHPHPSSSYFTSFTPAPSSLGGGGDGGGVLLFQPLPTSPPLSAQPMSTSLHAGALARIVSASSPGLPPRPPAETETEIETRTAFGALAHLRPYSGLKGTGPFAMHAHTPRRDASVLACPCPVPAHPAPAARSSRTTHLHTHMDRPPPKNRPAQAPRGARLRAGTAPWGWLRMLLHPTVGSTEGSGRLRSGVRRETAQGVPLLRVRRAGMGVETEGMRPPRGEVRAQPEQVPRMGVEGTGTRMEAETASCSTSVWTPRRRRCCSRVSFPIRAIRRSALSRIPTARRNTAVSRGSRGRRRASPRRRASSKRA